jgi:branched-chain amino acid aminotransferase
MAITVWLNGVVSSVEDARLSIADHAHLYGDGLFEGIRIYNGKVFKLKEHVDRLYHGLRYLDFKMNIEKNDLTRIILDTCHTAGEQNGYIRLNVTRGTGLGLDPKNIDQTPSTMVLVSSLSLYPPEAYEAGLNLITSSFRVIPADCIDPRVKCIGRYAANIMAKAEANRAGAGEGLMLNHQGYIAECTGDNFFLIKGKKLLTPHPSCGILEGVTRNTAMSLARANGFEVIESFLTPFDVFTADEAFLTGTAAQIIPMVTLDTKKVGDGKSGSATKELMAAYQEATKEGTAF